MHHATAYMQNILSRVGKPDVVSAVISHVQATTLTSHLFQDAQSYYYSSWVTLVDGLRGLHAGFYTWATVKLYYSVFIHCVGYWHSMVIAFSMSI